MNRLVALLTAVIASLGLISSQAQAAGLPIVISATVNYGQNTLTITGQNFGSSPTVTLDSLTFPTQSSAGSQIVANFPTGTPPSSFTPGTYFLTVVFKNQLPVIYTVDIGANGLQGPSGATGSTGPAGATGAPGPAGPAGPAGPIGLPGPAGAQGPVGTAGVAGATGPQGPAGATGATGAQGPQGPQGSQGAPGGTASPVTCPPGQFISQISAAATPTCAPLNQSATTVFGTVPVTVTPSTAFVVIPGLQATITTTGSGIVYVATDGGVQSMYSGTNPGDGSVIGIAIYVDGAWVGNGGFREIFALANGVYPPTAYWSESQVMNLGPGTHTIDVRAEGTGSGSNAIVSGDNTTPLQGELSVLQLTQ